MNGWGGGVQAVKSRFRCTMGMRGSDMASKLTDSHVPVSFRFKSELIFNASLRIATHFLYCIFNSRSGSTCKLVF